MAQNPTSSPAASNKRQKLTPIQEERIRHAKAKSANTPATDQRYQAVRKSQPTTETKLTPIEEARIRQSKSTHAALDIQDHQPSKKALKSSKVRRGLDRPRKRLPSLDLLSKSQHDTPDSLSQLHYHTSILQQLYVRHKNQHRGQLWFTQLNLLRRATRDLSEVAGELVELQRSPQTFGVSVKAEEVRRRFETQKTFSTRKRELEDWIRETLVPQCYVRFSVLVADGDGNFANLGVVLVGLIASVADTVGVPTFQKDQEMVEAGKKQAVLTEMKAMEKNERGYEVDKLSAQDDLGIMIQRAAIPPPCKDLQPQFKKQETVLDQDEPRVEDTDMKGEQERPQAETAAPTTKSGATAASKAKWNKRKVNKKKGNAIDDLFAGVG